MFIITLLRSWAVARCHSRPTIANPFPPFAFMKLVQQIWTFFASVQLAIFSLCCIALTSIIGTVVPQGETHAEYVARFGEKTATFFHILDIPRMYSSWWFYALLTVLAINLVVCSIDRFPTAWRLIRANSLDISPARLAAMSNVRRFVIKAPVAAAINWQQILRPLGRAQEASNAHGSLFLVERGRYSRLGVYLVHLSILVIFVGAGIGQLFGFKGSVMLPELNETDRVFATADSTPIPLGFTVRCQSFTIDYYDSGMVKEYRSRLSILEEGREVLSRDIVVNSPLQYKGITFYQSSYKPHPEFIVDIAPAGSAAKLFTLLFQEERVWEERGLRFGVINAEGSGQRAVRAKLWFKVGDGEPVTRWLADNETVTMTSEGKDYAIRVKQLYSTGLQVARDPGVWIVYGGCLLLVFGLYVAFFLSHRRMWLSLGREENGCVAIILAGVTNKNKLAFAKTFEQLAEDIERRTGSAG